MAGFSLLLNKIHLIICEKKKTFQLLSRKITIKEDECELELVKEIERGIWIWDYESSFIFGSIEFYSNCNCSFSPIIGTRYHGKDNQVISQQMEKENKRII